MEIKSCKYTEEFLCREYNRRFHKMQHRKVLRVKYQFISYLGNENRGGDEDEIQINELLQSNKNKGNNIKTIFFFQGK